MQKYAKAIAAVAGLVVYIIATMLGLDLGEVPGLDVDANILALGLIETVLVYFVPNKDNES